MNTYTNIHPERQERATKAKNNIDISASNKSSLSRVDPSFCQANPSWATLAYRHTHSQPTFCALSGTNEWKALHVQSIGVKYIIGHYFAGHLGWTCYDGTDGWVKNDIAAYSLVSSSMNLLWCSKQLIPSTRGTIDGTLFEATPGCSAFWGFVMDPCTFTIMIWSRPHHRFHPQALNPRGQQRNHNDL